MQTASLYLASPEVPEAAKVMARSGGENFSVAARLLAGRDRKHLLAVYGFARLADEIGDEHSGERLAALDWLESELDRAYAGEAHDPLLRALQSTLVECDLPREPLVRLIEANRTDQHMRRYQTWKQLEDYCELSANPVGELVLRVFGLLTPARLALSDRVCTALQLVEHLQDLAEDVARGRLYLPAEDLARFGTSHEQLSDLLVHAGEEGEGEVVRVGAPAPSGARDGVRSAVRETVRFEATRVRELLSAGAPLVGSVPGRAKLAVAGYVAGGVAAVEAIERAGFDVLAGAPHASRTRRVWALGRVFAESRR
ncbi:MAG: squalene synthase HpnC [Solirubrobacteraceae bacterium]